MSAQFHPSEDLVVSASLDQTARIWDISGMLQWVLVKCIVLQTLTFSDNLSKSSRNDTEHLLCSIQPLFAPFTQDCVRRTFPQLVATRVLIYQQLVAVLLVLLNYLVSGNYFKLFVPRSSYEYFYWWVSLVFTQRFLTRIWDQSWSMSYYFNV